MALEPLKYLNADGSINRELFRKELWEYANEKDISLSQAFADIILSRGDLDRSTRGQFALAISHNQDVVTAAVILVNAFDRHDREEAESKGFLDDYFGLDRDHEETKITSWKIDNLLGWAMGTALFGDIWRKKANASSELLYA